jgi:hypothetical protein
VGPSAHETKKNKLSLLLQRCGLPGKVLAFQSLIDERFQQPRATRCHYTGSLTISIMLFKRRHKRKSGAYVGRSLELRYELYSKQRPCLLFSYKAKTHHSTGNGLSFSKHPYGQEQSDKPKTLRGCFRLYQEKSCRRGQLVVSAKRKDTCYKAP